MRAHAPGALRVAVRITCVGGGWFLERGAGAGPAAVMLDATVMHETAGEIPEGMGRVRLVALVAAGGLVGLWGMAAGALVMARWVDPATTAVHVERRVEAWVAGRPYTERYTFVPLREISPDFQHAVIAAEDARFYQHHGFDWQAMEIAAEGDMEGGGCGAGRRLRSSW